MKGLLLLIGESFRLGSQNTRTRGLPESYQPQVHACNTHLNLLKHMQDKDIEMSVFIGTYTTSYDDVLMNMYKDFLTNKIILQNPFGLNNLFHLCVNSIDLLRYDFLLYCRIDLFLKNLFFDRFDPFAQKILYPSICFTKYNFHVHEGHPRVNDMMLFVPKKYYQYVNDITIGHESWSAFMNRTSLTYDDLDTLLPTFHDSDSEKDMNPLYYIVNRPQSLETFDKGIIFDKYAENFILTNEI